MPIVAVVHTKGGVGKTTTAANLAVMSARAGRRVLLVDSDSGQSSAAFVNARKLADATPEIPFVSLCSYRLDDGSWYRIDADIRRLAPKFDDVIIDAGGEGHGSPEIRMALAVADKVVTPCRTPKADTDRLAPMNNLIADARGFNAGLRAFLFPTQASTNAQAKDVVDFYRDVARFQQYGLLETVVRSRTCYQSWARDGLAIVEHKRRDRNAVEEMEGLYGEVFNG
jgi:chromosome partitioning protein